MLSHTKFDYFLHMGALWNHWSYLDCQWDFKDKSAIQINASGDENKKIKFIGCYTAGIVGHILCLASKIGLLALSIIVTLGISFHYLAGKMCRMKEGEKQRQARLNECFLTITEILPSMSMDVVGLICPPLAYKIHFFIQQNFTNYYLKKWDIIEETCFLTFSECTHQFFYNQ
jgi:hypothetical protein